MNCKPDQMAWVAAPGAAAYGHIVRTKVIHPAGTGDWAEEHGPVWSIHGTVPADWAFGVCESPYFPDCGLKPIDGGETPEESAEAIKKLHHIPTEVTA